MPRLVQERADVIPVLGEIFREHGFEGATLAVISRRTGLGKGSLYHFFPGGKEEMAAAVLAEIDRWFVDNVYLPLQRPGGAAAAIAAMCTAVSDYFRAGRRICLVGAFALAATRDRFATGVDGYFRAWVAALATALAAAGHAEGTAKDLAEEAVAAIQGALVLARALDDPDIFQRAMRRVAARLLPP